jgi:hypothetical protein
MQLGLRIPPRVEEVVVLLLRSNLLGEMVTAREKRTSRLRRRVKGEPGASRMRMCTELPLEAGPAHDYWAWAREGWRGASDLEKMSELVSRRDILQ